MCVMVRFTGLRRGGRICKLCTHAIGERGADGLFCSKVFASFGGLLMYLEGPHKRLSNLRQDYIYLLLKK